MNLTTKPFLVLLSGLLLALAGAASAAADWLVTKDGARVETKGPWKVEGRRVLFTMPNGTLSAMRATDIDFEASEAVTVAAMAPPTVDPMREAEEAPRPEPVLVLTNKDIAPGTVPVDAAEAKPEVLPSIAEREPVQVITWKRYDTEEGIELRGTVRNTGASIAANIRIQVTVKNEDDEVVGTGNAFLRNGSLVSGRSTSFRVVMPVVDDFVGEPDFVVTSSRITIGGGAASRASGDDAESQEGQDTEDPDGQGQNLDSQNLDGRAEGADEDEEPLDSEDDDIKP